MADAYDAPKEFRGRRYTGMRVGGRHHWNYFNGDWRETKLTPHKWSIQYHAYKSRNRPAPHGSGAPVGTQYHWFVLAHQEVRKIDANVYRTFLHGLKHKLDHRRADSETWASSRRVRSIKLVHLLRKTADELEASLRPGSIDGR